MSRLKFLRKVCFALMMASVIFCGCGKSSRRIEKLLSLPTEIDINSIQFKHETFKSAWEESREKGLPLFIYFTGDGCGPCLWMERTVFTDSMIMNFFNQNFICVKSHRKRLSTTVRSAEEMKLNKPIDLVMKEYGVYGIPSFIVIDFNGNLIHKSIDSSDKEDFIQFGKDALSDDRNYAAIKTKVENGNYSYELVKSYLAGNNPTSKSLKRKKQKIIDNYFATQDQSEWSSTQNWYLIDRHIDTEDFDSEQFQYLLHNTNTFYEKQERATVDLKLYRVLGQYLFNGGKINKLNNHPIANMIVEKRDLEKMNITDINLYAKSFNDIYTKYYYLLEFEINRKSREIYEESIKSSHTIQTETLTMAEKWMELLISHRTEEEEYVDTYEKLKRRE